MADFRFVSLIPEATDGASCKSTLSKRIREALPNVVLQWFHFSLLRQVLLESHSMLYRISLSPRKRTVLNYAEVGQSLPQVSCSDSRNEMQFCSASIQKLSVERPYLSIADLRLFAAGFLQAQKWFLHMSTECRIGQQDSCAITNDSTFGRRDQAPVRMAQEPQPHRAERQHLAFRSGAES